MKPDGTFPPEVERDKRFRLLVERSDLPLRSKNFMAVAAAMPAFKFSAVAQEIKERKATAAQLKGLKDALKRGPNRKKADEYKALRKQYTAKAPKIHWDFFNSLVLPSRRCCHPPVCLCCRFFACLSHCLHRQRARTKSSISTCRR
jgi:hypothetical protein